MKRSAFRTAQLPPALPLYKLAAGVLFAALVLAASANGGGTPTVAKPATRTVATKSQHSQHWYQVGVASWYGGQFQGRTTAAGETYDMNQLTCAHPTLPMGTWLRVTNLKNRKAAYVRVNDRGPVVDGRIVDLSYAAARVIGLSGLGKVKLEKVHQDDPAIAQSFVAQLQVPILFNPLGSIAR